MKIFDMGKIHWTPDKEQYLRDNYPTGDTHELARQFGSSYWAITSRAKKLKLRKQPGFMTLSLNSIWRTVDIEEFKRLYPTTSNNELARKYGIDYRKVKNHANRLGLKKDSEHKNSGQYKRPIFHGSQGQKE